jgi:hypothetical protein
MILIKGAYTGSAVHIVPEMMNESYTGYFSSNSEDESAESELEDELNDEDQNVNDDVTHPFCPLNDRL